MSLAFEEVDPYSVKANGIWGDFRTSENNQVLFLSTVARLSANPDDAAAMKFTSKLRPVREIVNTAELRFSELLQRDLDDFRVSNNLIPYLLSQTGHEASFFPPILAVLLPYQNQAQTEFSEFVVGGEWIDNLKNRWDCGTSVSNFQFKRLCDSAGNLLMEPRIGRLEWNDHRTKLMVIDGQHRAMALLALYRTKFGEWPEGNQFKHFYEERWGKELENIELPNIDIPVTICFFPKLCGPGHSIHKAARTLFVDVNRNARQPSEARNILLSESHLLEIFTRAFMDQVRDFEQEANNQGSAAELPLASIEYDRSSGEATKWDRYTCMTNVETLRDIIDSVVWGPKKYHDELIPAIKGAAASDDAVMRTSLSLLEAVGDMCGDMEVEKITNSVFPRDRVDEIRQPFIDEIGIPLIRLFASVEPFRSHHRAVRLFEADWRQNGDLDYLLIARQAVLEGSGQYWALKEASRVRNDRRKAEGVDLPETTATQAWAAIENRRELFEAQRATVYLGLLSKASVNRAFSSAMTIAGELGLALLLPFLKSRMNSPSVRLVNLGPQVSLGINSFLDSKTPDDVPRKLIWDGTATLGTFLFFGLDRTRWREMRLIWLRMVLSPESLSAMDDSIVKSCLQPLVDELRAAIDDGLLKFRLERFMTELKQEYPDQKTRHQVASRRAFEVLHPLINGWFGDSTLAEPNVSDDSGVHEASVETLDVRAEDAEDD